MQVKLKVILSNGISHDWRGQGAALSIGRDPECDLTIEDGEDRIVSWMHARIECDSDAARIRDFRSKNGTYVNEEPVDGTRPLQIGDTIHLGRKGPKLIVLELDTHQDDIAPVPPPIVSSPSGLPGGFAGNMARWGLRQKRWLVAGALGVAALVFIMLTAMIYHSREEPPGHHVPMVGATTSAVADARSTGFSRNSRETPPEGGTANEEPPKGGTTSAASSTAGSVAEKHSRKRDPIFTTEELVKRHSGAVVWLGAEFDQRRLPLCSGFAVDRTKIVCTAREIVQLKGYHQEGKPVFVYCERCSPKFLRVVELKVHRAYDPKDPTSSASLLHNVGVAIVESPVPGSVDLLPSRELPRPPKDLEVTAGWLFHPV